jgi:hypothetical protein
LTERRGHSGLEPSQESFEHGIGIDIIPNSLGILVYRDILTKVLSHLAKHPAYVHLRYSGSVFEFANHRRDRHHVLLFIPLWNHLTVVVGACPSWPIYAGEVQSKSLGMAVEVYSQSGSNDLEASGQPGELVCTMPFPSMPLVLWGDRTGETYRKAYYERFPGVWHHGDFLAINPKTKGIIMLGRRFGAPLTFANFQ